MFLYTKKKKKKFFFFFFMVPPPPPPPLTPSDFETHATLCQFDGADHENAHDFFPRGLSSELLSSTTRPEDFYYINNVYAYKNKIYYCDLKLKECHFLYKDLSTTYLQLWKLGAKAQVNIKAVTKTSWLKTLK